MSKRLFIDRRTCLKGVGAALALPLLDGMGWAETTGGPASKPPVRLGFMYMPHGVIMDQFWPADAASFLAAPPPALESLRPVIDQCLLMKGISGVPISPFNGAPHALELSTWLTATLPDPDKRDEVSIAISADQIAANYVGAFTTLPSLELATMPQTWKENQEGLNEAYYSHCSFRSPTQAVPAEINPRNVLKRLFNKQDQRGGGNASTEMSSLDRNMLDLVLGGARELRRTLSVPDQRKLDEYLDSVRSVERRIAAIEMRQKEAALEKAGVRPSRRRDSDSPPIEIKIPEGDRRSEYMQVMCDLSVLAFQTDTTRVCTYIGSTPNGVSYPELGFNDQHHSQTHHNHQAEKVRKVAAITAFNIEQFAYMVKKMHSLREGDGTLLDNCIMMWGSGLEDGNKHTRENLPFILAGRGGGSINTGRFLPDVKGNQGDLLTTLLTCAGIPLDRPVGIATKQITEIASSA
ncbi:DUF1552 domain-containing protein [Roseiconus nitratireducens]|uniref:DUF1552 domain-containing protein n=1 Tax=Roseiconus nitratireducens TaxID=2605748 RepID=A0A5M6D789_9BACT|nr:DUF1552 domain-containing protein [Roseiconus nitratireducens]KAA5542142.1 DUF1552 domain-containing protein [Roseiconus nitratireducens]